MTGVRTRLIRVVTLAAAVALVALLLTARPTAVDEFFRRPSPPPAVPESTHAFVADSAATAGGLIAIHLDVESRISTIDVTPPPPPPPARREGTEPPPAPTDSTAPGPDLDVDDLLEGAGAPRAGGGSKPVDAIPPRPVEITWPETKRLEACVGRSVEVRVLVGEDGRVRDVRSPETAGVDDGCIAAAVETARRIRFEPGKVGGLPATLWTQVRVDFDRKK